MPTAKLIPLHRVTLKRDFVDTRTADDLRNEGAPSQYPPEVTDGTAPRLDGSVVKSQIHTPIDHKPKSDWFAVKLFACITLISIGCAFLSH